MGLIRLYLFYFGINGFSHTASPCVFLFWVTGSWALCLGTEQEVGPASRGQASALCRACVSEHVQWGC